MRSLVRQIAVEIIHNVAPQTELPHDIPSRKGLERKLVGTHDRRPDKNDLAQRRLRAVRLHLEMWTTPVRTLFVMRYASLTALCPNRLPIQNSRPHDMSIVQVLDLCESFSTFALP